MNNSDFNRRQFLQSAFYSSLVLGSAALPGIISNAAAMPASLNKRILVNLNLSGGPDLRHLIVPAFDPADDSFGGKYWKHRARAHKLAETGVTAQQRYEDDYVEFTVGNGGWNAQGLVDASGINSSVKFGIWREAGWLIDMFSRGNAALVFNAVGGTNRAHDLSSLMLEQGDVLTSLNKRDGSGWGGRLARSAGGKAISLTSSPSPFLFGPVGAAPNYNPASTDNIDLRSIESSRDIGLFDFNIESDQLTNFDDKMARAAKSYYAALRQEQIGLAYQKARDHEQTVREFGELVSGLLNDTNIPIPQDIRALYETIAGVNIDPNDSGNNGRRVLRSTGFGRQIRNLYDMIAVNDLTQLDPRVLSLEYGGWDSHGNQRQIPAVLATDPNNPFVDRGIEDNLRDIFGGKFGPNPNDPSALHGGFSSLWASLPAAADRANIAVTIAGEFGRQIRDNGDSGTDHGKGNLMLVIGERVRGGVYGEIFQDAEVDKYDNTSIRTPDIDPLTEIDSIFSKVSDWVVPGSGSSVYRRTAPNFSGEAPLIEVPGMFNNLFL
jgi:uncharacterized protein (DUF1501 family)